MNIQPEVVTLIGSILACIISVTTLISWRNKQKAETRAEGANEAKTQASLDTIKLQNENLLTGNRSIQEKLDNQNERLVRLEQTVTDAHLSEMPKKIAKIEESVKSAHKRIDGLESKKK